MTCRGGNWVKGFTPERLSAQGVYQTYKALVYFEERGAVVKVVRVEIGFCVLNLLKMLYSLIYEGPI